MKKILLAGLLLPLLTQAQWNVNLYGGFSNYFGDLQEHPYTTQQANGSFGAGLQYDLNGHFLPMDVFQPPMVTPTEPTIGPGISTSRP